MPYRVAVLGGGMYGNYAASMLASSTDAEFDVSLFTLTEFAVCMPASVRLVSGGFKPTDVAINYSEFLHKKVDLHVVKEITSFDEQSVTFVMANTEVVATKKFDYIILATGMKWSDPMDYTELNGYDFRALQEYNNQHLEKLKKAKKIVVVGGGEVGCELTGELAYTFKNKDITIVHSQAKLLSNHFIDRVRDNVESHFIREGVKFKYSVRAELPPSDGRTLKLSNGETITDIDVLIKTIGPKPNLPHTSLNLANEDGYVKINDFGQSLKYSNIFAIGDVAATTMKTIIVRDEAVKKVIHNLTQLTKGASTSGFQKLPALILEQQDRVPKVGISLGPENGTGQFKLPLIGAIAVPHSMIVSRKSKDLFTDEAHRDHIFYKCR